MHQQQKAGDILKDLKLRYLGMTIDWGSQKKDCFQQYLGLLCLTWIVLDSDLSKNIIITYLFVYVDSMPIVFT
jgi:hypothetical protein